MNDEYKNFLNMFIAFLYMFRATMCPSSGENTVPMRHLLFVTLYRWMSGMQGGIHSALHTRRSSIWSDKYEVPHRYLFSPDYEYSCPKQVENSNKHIKKICAPSWFYLQKIIQGCAVNRTLKKELTNAYKTNWAPPLEEKKFPWLRWVLSFLFSLAPERETVY